MQPPAEIFVSEYQESTGFYFHIVSVNFYASVPILTVLTAGGWDRDFTVTASLTVYNGNFNAIRHEGSKVARNCMDASAIFIINTRNLNPNFSGCRNRIFDFDIPALDLTSFEWTYVLPYARINFPFILPSICLKDIGKTKLIREATWEGHISCCLRVLTIRKRGMYSQYSRRNLGSIICLTSPHVRASVMDHGQEGRVCVTTHWP